MSALVYPHIRMSPEGVPYIEGTTTKVVEIVEAHFAHHWSAAQLQREYPYLRLAQIHSALAYYYDHQSELDDDMARRRRRADEIRARREDATNRDKLKKLGHLP